MTPPWHAEDLGEPFNEMREWRRHGSADDIQAEVLLRLLALWRGRCHRDGRLPARSDFSARDLMALGGIVSLIDVERQPMRFHMRLIGSHLTHSLGRDNSGRYADDIYGPEVYPLIFDTYRQCVETRLPVWTSGRLRHTEKDFMRFESIDLPLARDGQIVDMILKGTSLEDLET
ncbi:MAG: PAS domain-containing protein [Sneathiellaceae bacterium]